MRPLRYTKKALINLAPGTWSLLIKAAVKKRLQPAVLIRKIIEDWLEGHKDNRVEDDNREDWQREIVSRCKTIEELRAAIYEIGDVEGSRGYIYGPNENIARLNSYLDGIAGENFLTRGAGLRKKMIELAGGRG